MSVWKLYDQSAGWSPKGSRILFAWSTLDEGWGLAWVRPDGSGLETLELYAGRGRFSPDGRKIAYVRDGNLKLMNMAGRRTRLLTSDASSDGYAPDWSPDGAGSPTPDQAACMCWRSRPAGCAASPPGGRRR